uniref:Uncharacterized protein n=1 Tax=Arundo donax TaxID=35708 RepID=A0A0A9EGV6_ARUDO
MLSFESLVPQHGESDSLSSNQENIIASISMLHKFLKRRSPEWLSLGSSAQQRMIRIPIGVRT